MIEAQNVSKKYSKLKALDAVSVKCNTGEAIALIGPNGSGKTTLIKCILSMVIPDAGIIKVNNNPIKNSWLYKNRIGYMPQIGRYPENMTIGQIIDMMKDIRKSDTSSIDEELIYAFELDKLKAKRMRTLSGGTTQKVSASLAFLFNPDILILDEPTAGLDPVASEILKSKILKERGKGKLILITSHVLSELDDLVTEVMYMQEGKVLFHKKLSALKQDTGEKQLSKAIAKVMQIN
jgi:Cu-processing system ATP-binding protein